MKLVLALTVLLQLFISPLFAQSVIDQLGGGNSYVDLPPLATEKILTIAQSKRIFIITNNNSSFNKGDFISIVRNSKLVTRALVAKETDDSRAGIKILKLYSLSLWNELREGMEVQILKGDDTAFRNIGRANEDAVASKISDEDDLYNETLLEDDLNVEEDSKRVIRTDNIIGLGYSSVEGIDNNSNSNRYNQLNASYAFQIEDNIWVEALYGQSVVRDFPALGIDTKLSNLTVRAKYTISAPFYSYVQPYVGYQMLGASSPGAGVQDESNPVSESELQRELDLVEDMKKNSVIFGVTILKRLVPGWFAKVDLGSDIINFGLSLEF